MTHNKRVLIVGGVAGGASCAARARRMSEEAEIVIFERGPYVSFANCGLPYYIGNVIQDESKLLVASPELFRDRFNIDVRVRSEVLGIDPARQEITVSDGESGCTYRERYDALVLSPGAVPLRPPLPGIDLPGIFTLRTIPDSRKIREWIAQKQVRRAVVIGAGFIGMEMVENLVERECQVSLVEMLPQVMPALDPEMAAPLEDRLKLQGVALYLAQAAAGFEQHEDGSLRVELKSGVKLEADLVIIGIGVRPEVTLARDARLELGPRGGIQVDEQMRTSDRHIWAVGDAVEVLNAITGELGPLPLAGPANRQGRVAADSIFGRPARFRGVQGTAVCGVMGMTAALTGCTERMLVRVGARYEKIYLHPGHHVAYYPGAKPIHLKLLFSPDDGRVLGAQAVGEEGVERRIDVLSMAIQKGSTVFDLEEAELCYAPQYGAAKDPVNVAGMVAANVLRGDVSQARWEELETGNKFLLDVRNPEEFNAGHIPGAANIPLPLLRSRLDELPRDRQIWLYCGVGQRSYYATRILRLRGFNVRNLPGGFETYTAMQAASL